MCIFNIFIIVVHRRTMTLLLNRRKRTNTLVTIYSLPICANNRLFMKHHHLKGSEVRPERYLGVFVAWLHSSNGIRSGHRSSHLHNLSRVADLQDFALHSIAYSVSFYLALHNFFCYSILRTGVVVFYFLLFGGVNDFNLYICFIRSLILFGLSLCGSEK